MNPQFKDAFVQGFGSIFRQWTALELAVHNEWGGPQSAEKANDLMNQVMAIFDDPKRIFKDVRQQRKQILWLTKVTSRRKSQCSLRTMSKRSFR
jgi:hypothetical protein